MLESLEFKAHNNSVYVVHFAFDLLISAGDDGEIKVWSVPEFELVNVVSAHKKSIRGLSFSLNNHYLATMSIDNTIRLWKFPEIYHFHDIAEAQGCIFSQDDRFLLTISQSKLNLWNYKAKKISKSIALNLPIFSFAFQQDSSTIVLGSTNSVVIFDLIQERIITSLEHPTNVYSLRISPDGNTLITVDISGNLKFWSTKDWSTFRNIRLDFRGPIQVLFSRNGKYLFVGNKKCILMYSMTNGLPDAPPQYINLPIEGYGFAISPNGTILAVPMSNGHIFIKNLQ